MKKSGKERRGVNVFRYRLTRSFNLIVVISMMSVIAWGCGRSGSEADVPDKVIIGTQNLSEPEAIAKAEGWFEEALGTKVDIVQFNGGSEFNTAMASGEIDFGMLGSTPAAMGIANGVDCQIIYVQSVLGEIESLIVNSEIEISSADDLKGLTIATPFSTTSHYSLLKYLETNEINPTEIDIVDMKPSDTVAAYSRGDIDGAFIWDPQCTELMELGAVRITSAKEIAELGYATMDVEIVKTSFAEKYPDIVTKYIACMDRAVELYRTDEESAGVALEKQLGISADAALAQVASSTWMTVDEQLSADWFGGEKLAENLYNTAMFLFEQGDILEKPDMKIFKNAVNGQYMAALRQ